MTDGPVTELPTIKQQERPSAPKPPELKASEKPVGQGEQKIIERIGKDGDPDQVLEDIAGGRTPTEAGKKGTSKSDVNAKVESRPESEANSLVASSPEQAVIDEATAFKVLSNDPSASNTDKIAAATQHPNIAARLGWTPADIEELKQELAASQMPEEENTSAIPANETEVTREQLQQETFGRLYGDLLTAFAETPGITKEELMRRVGKYAKEHRLAGPNLGKAVGIVNRFCQTRDLVRSVREQYPDDRALFKHTFGFSPQGEVQVIMGTINIAFYIPNIDDRARAHTGDAQREDRTARTAAGAVLNRVRDPSLSGLVIALEYKDTPDVLNHERYHVVNNQILKMRELKDTNNETLDTMSERIKTGDNPETAISSFLDSLRATRLRHASDEIIAFFAGGTRPEQTKQALTHQRSSYGERFRGLTTRLENMIVDVAGEQHRKYVIEQGNRELGEGYDQSIRDCVDAFQTLRSTGYSQEQAVGFLFTIPPQDWKNFVINKAQSKDS